MPWRTQLPPSAFFAMKTSVLIWFPNNEAGFESLCRHDLSSVSLQP